MYVEFRKLRLSSFLSYGKTPTEFILNRYPSTLCIGESGSGKSALPNGMSFVLFNDTLRKVKKGHLVNWDNGKNCWGEVDFRIGSDDYTVRRAIKPDGFDIIKNGTPLSKDTRIKDLQAYLVNDILKFDKMTFNQMVSLAEVNFVSFMHLELKDRRAITEKIFDLEILSIMNAILKGKAKEVVLELEALMTEAKSIGEKISIHKSYVEKKKNESKQQLKDLKAEIAQVKEQKEKLAAEIEEIKEKELAPMVQDIPELKEMKEKLETTRNKLAKVQAKIQLTKKRQKLIEENDVCPNCERAFSPEYAKTEKEKLSAELTSLEEISEKGNSIKAKIETRINREEDRYDKIKAIKLRIDNKNFSLDQLTKNIDRLEKQAERLKESKEEGLQEMMTEIEELETKLSEIKVKEEEKTELKALQDVSLNLLKDDGVKAEIIRKSIPRLNAYVNRFLEAMNFSVSFRMNQDFEEEIRAKGRDAYTYNSFSGGQRQRIDLALIFAWREMAKARNSVNTNLLFLDEVLDSHLNVEATESVLEMLSSDLFKGTNLFVVSHKKDIASRFSRVINFELKDGFTRIS